MQPGASLPLDEYRRLEALRAYEVLDTPPERSFDELAHLASRVCDSPMALVCFIDEKRQWCKARVDFDLVEAPRGASFCEHTIRGKTTFVVPDALLDERFRESPLVTSAPHVRFYAGAPLLTPAGVSIGTLCVMDHVPRRLSEGQTDSLTSLSRQVVALLELRRSLVELAMARETRRRAHADLHRFFSLSLDMLCIAGFDGVFRELNPSWERILGFTLEELKARPFLDFVHPDDRERTIAESARLMAGGETVSFENRYRCRDGSYRWLLWSVAVSVERGVYYAVARDISDRKRVEETLKRDALHDPLTGLANRTKLLDWVERSLARARLQPQHRFALLYVDLDGFKGVNDSFGHVAGDELLVAVAARLLASVRPGDTVARLGGDEFIAALDGVPDEESARSVAERIVRDLSVPYRVVERDVAISASVGIVLAGESHGRPIELLRDADTALYRAKALGKGRVEVAVAG